MQGWKCPNCGKAHAPHVETCPEPNTDYIGTPLPRPPTVVYPMPVATTAPSLSDRLREAVEKMPRVEVVTKFHGSNQIGPDQTRARK